MKTKFKTAGIVVKSHPDVCRYLEQTLAFMQKRGVSCLLDNTAAQLLKVSSGIAREELAAKVDILIVLGGDGTFLSVARAALEAQVPIAGFNLGRLGFLTELNKETLENSLQDILQGKATISERKVLYISLPDSTVLALNDVVVHKGDIARIVNLLLCVNGEKVAEIKGDGVIVATPTGSTAYSLSAGGPIVSPTVNGLIITPVCAHSLTFRPLIVPDSSQIAIRLLSANTPVYVTIDGQKVMPLNPENDLNVTAYEKKLHMVTSTDISYFALLNKKLNWGV